MRDKNPFSTVPEKEKAVAQDTLNKAETRKTQGKSDKYITCIIVGAAIIFCAIKIPRQIRLSQQADIAKACETNLWQIETAKFQWVRSHLKVRASDPIRLDDLPIAVRNLKCPGGGSYQPNSVIEAPSCTLCTNKECPHHIILPGFAN